MSRPAPPGRARRTRSRAARNKPVDKVKTWRRVSYAIVPPSFPLGLRPPAAVGVRYDRLSSSNDVIGKEHRICYESSHCFTFRRNSPAVTVDIIAFIDK